MRVKFQHAILRVIHLLSARLGGSNDQVDSN